MNWRDVIGSILIATLTSTQAFARPAAQDDGHPSVDLELVIAVDVSYSMEPADLAAQREGFAKAIESPEFLRSLRAGPIGKIALTYFEWASTSDQRIVVPWRQIDGLESAQAVATELRQAPIRRGSRTSISSAIDFAVPLFEQNPCRGARCVIDISGDGPNNNGGPVATARDTAVQKGIVITALPVMTTAPLGPTDINHMDHLDWYYEDCVIGGSGAFALPITDRGNFNDATRTQLALVVAGRTPNGSTARPGDKEPRILCTIGEKLWQERWLSNTPATFGPPAKSPAAIDPAANNPMANDDAKKEDALLAKKIKGICRGC
ncbi:DUF1194 domain-containing protein [Bradyrhizobium sp. CCBAU 51745]|uniref:DUF1194 domain-containing protein n=1 Tax=Bradyrhizobium sp. CCBAU 51745 TaxID=1325099 RepID=UPI002304FB85|nr:DUF1194 domain-containing protein [Bradyrhizobium sp. CCBAU 51745]